MSAKQPTLLELSIEVANQVLEKLKIEEVLTCRKVCRSLRTAIDKIGAYFNRNIHVCLGSNRVSLTFNRITITYSSSSLGGIDVWCDSRRRKKGFIRDDNYLNIAFNDLKILLKHAMCLTIKTTLGDLGDNDREYAVNTLAYVLKEDVNNIHVDTIRLFSDLSIDDVLLLLPLFNSQPLQFIGLGVDKLSDRKFRKFRRDKHRIFCLDQWKNAKYLQFNDTWPKCPPIKHFFHFEGFCVTMEDFPLQNVIKIRDDLLQRCTFQGCTISVLIENIEPVEFARVFQPDYAGDDRFTMEYSNGKFKFKINCILEAFIEWTFEIKRC